MTKTKISRKELLKSQDEFMTLTSRAIKFVQEHRRKFDYLGMAILGLIVIYLGSYAYIRYINKKGLKAYNTAYYSAMKIAESSKDQVAAEKKVEDMFEGVVKDYASSKAAKLALPEVASAEFTERKYDEAITNYETYMGKVSENDPYKSLARLSLSVCYEEKGQFDKAIEPLEKIMEGPDDSIKEQAMLSMARIYRLSSKQDKSNEILKQFKEKFPKSIYVDLADSLLKS
jgi:predicted negative regulator of RcsB-dependent stress response